MKKIRANVSLNDRIVAMGINKIENPENPKKVEYESIQYLYVDARTRKAVPLGKAIPFSLSVKKYFGEQGKTIRQLYDFKDWHNKKLTIEIERIWYNIDVQFRRKSKLRLKQAVREVYDDERAA